MRILSIEDRHRILSRLFDEQTQTGRPVAAAAMRILSKTRRDSVWAPSDDDVVSSLSAQHSGGKPVNLSSAYVDANLAPLPPQTQERVAALLRLYDKGQEEPCPSPFGGQWKN